MKPTHPMDTDIPRAPQPDPTIIRSYRDLLSAAIDIGDLDSGTDIDYLIGLLRQCPAPTAERRPDHRLSALTYRLSALYHSCMSSASYAREDGEKARAAGDRAAAEAAEQVATAWESAAGWLQSASH